MNVGLHGFVDARMHVILPVKGKQFRLHTCPLIVFFSCDESREIKMPLGGGFIFFKKSPSWGNDSI